MEIMGRPDLDLEFDENDTLHLSRALGREFAEWCC